MNNKVISLIFRSHGTSIINELRNVFPNEFGFKIENGLYTIYTDEEDVVKVNNRHWFALGVKKCCFKGGIMETIFIVIREDWNIQDKASTFDKEVVRAFKSEEAADHWCDKQQNTDNSSSTFKSIGYRSKYYWKRIVIDETI